MRPPNLTLTRDDGSVYLKRWHLIPRNRLFNIYLHQFLGSDDDRALHDHPWAFVSVLVKGGYWEHREDGWMTWRGTPSVAFCRANTAHRVELDREVIDIDSYWTMSGPIQHRRVVEKPAWTVIFTGPKIRSWGFHCGDTWTHWRRFDLRGGCA